MRDPTLDDLSPMEEELGFLRVALVWESGIDEHTHESIEKVLPCVACILDHLLSCVIRIPNPSREGFCYMLHIYGIHQERPDSGIMWHCIQGTDSDNPEIALHQAALCLESTTFPIQRVYPCVHILEK